MENYESKDFDIDNIENNFIEKMGNTNDDLSKINKSILIPYDIISNVFLYPVNETIFEKSYLKSKYYTGYKIKISNSIWILCYLHHFDLHSEELIWTIYDSKSKQVKSNLVIASWNDGTEKRIISFDGKRISITSTYKRNFKNGMDGDNSKPIEALETFEISKDYRFIKIK
ncbi:hypothetical protein C1637_15235 [Chryseobacterium lactis]|uniref:Uncharacterized protein n=2 Tax=Chryseobacterium lactis TaxID=1241981 RepID=A0A3G6RI82_CHRLC|nr:hypothetical protein [Chryseobacterium lactis]AZA83534.1 hypothetical protein EG342_17330 [Chryseobacterium lactis]AZB03918.1 hypothetical protein EG341_08205 [Chryseobacterium lactis]PNW13172.1 hypothetical protein C1637_15235 [Chryseobacterium lactis]